MTAAMPSRIRFVWIWTTPISLKSLYKVIRSLRDSVDGLHSVVEEFVVKHAQTKAHTQSEDAVRAWWMTLSADASWAEELVAVDPRWHGCVLWTPLSLADDPAAVKRLAHCLRIVLKFTKFSETRWCTVGSSCKALVVALSVGLERIVELARAK